jgi:hypothetical protein
VCFSALAWLYRGLFFLFLFLLISGDIIAFFCIAPFGAVPKATVHKETRAHTQRETHRRGQTERHMKKNAFVVGCTRPTVCSPFFVSFAFFRDCCLRIFRRRTHILWRTVWAPGKRLTAHGEPCWRNGKATKKKRKASQQAARRPTGRYLYRHYRHYRHYHYYFFN